MNRNHTLTLFILATFIALPMHAGKFDIMVQRTINNETDTDIALTICYSVEATHACDNQCENLHYSFPVKIAAHTKKNFNIRVPSDRRKIDFQKINSITVQNARKKTLATFIDPLFDQEHSATLTQDNAGNYQLIPGKIQ